MIDDDEELIEAVLDCVDPASNCLIGNDEVARAREVYAKLIDERDALKQRQQELLATIVRLTNETPFSDEARDALEQRGKLVAEIGTYRARVAELEKECAGFERLATEAIDSRNALVREIAEYPDRLPLVLMTERMLIAEFERNVARLQRDEAIRETDRWRHGVTIEGDHVCPRDLECDDLKAKIVNISGERDRLQRMLETGEKLRTERPTKSDLGEAFIAGYHAGWDKGTSDGGSGGPGPGAQFEKWIESRQVKISRIGVSLAEQTERIVSTLTPREREVLAMRFRPLREPILGRPCHGCGHQPDEHPNDSGCQLWHKAP